jgi:hypothetical protein
MWQSIAAVGTLIITQAVMGQSGVPAHPLAATPLELRLSHGPLMIENIPLTRALREIGFQVQDGYVLFGVEARLHDGKEPTLTLNLPRGATLAAALEQVMNQLSDYEYSVEGEHIVDIYPKGAQLDSHDILNTRVESFSVTNKSASALLTIPQSYIPALHSRLVAAGQPSGTGGSRTSQVGEPTVSLTIREVTVRQILNAVSQATEAFPHEYFPLGWSCLFELPSVPSAQANYFWRPLYSAPRNWKQESRSASPKQIH